MKHWGRIVFGCGIALAPVYACLLDIPDAMTGDASVDGGSDVNANPPDACATLDTSCVAAIPSGWQPVILPTKTAPSCASDFAPTTFVADPKLGASACVCPTCAATGSYSCDASVQVLGNSASCTTSAKINPGQCTNFAASGYAEYFAYGAVGAVTCDAGQPTDTTVTTTSVTACFPSSCTTDFCGAQGTKCITIPEIAGCPVDYPSSMYVGSSATANCTPCGCTVPPALCSGTLNWYTTVGCGGSSGTVTSSNNCQSIGQNILSVEFAPGFPPSAKCTEQQDAQSTVSLNQSRTICCAP